MISDNAKLALESEWEVNDDYPLASEDQLQDFEAEYSEIPADFRWFLERLGGGSVADEWVDDIERLAVTHEKLRNDGSWEVEDFFAIGWDSSGNPLGISLTDGRVLVLDPTSGPEGYELAPSFGAMLLEQFKDNPKFKNL